MLRRLVRGYGQETERPPAAVSFPAAAFCPCFLTSTVKICRRAEYRVCGRREVGRRRIDVTVLRSIQAGSPQCSPLLLNGGYFPPVRSGAQWHEGPILRAMRNTNCQGEVTDFAGLGRGFFVRCGSRIQRGGGWVFSLGDAEMFGLCGIGFVRSGCRVYGGAERYNH